MYLLYFLLAIPGGILTRQLIVVGDAAATMHSILMHGTQYRAGFAIGLIANACYIVLTAMLYRLFKPVNATVALAAALFSMSGAVIQIAGSLFQLAPLAVLSGGGLATAFTPEQVEAMTLVSLKLSSQAMNIGFVLFALFDLSIGYLIVKSTFLPRILGILMLVAGAGWLSFVWEPLAIALAAPIAAVGVVAELALMLWLLVKGVDAARWRESAGPR